jgi:hypothetical protein
VGIKSLRSSAAALTHYHQSAFSQHQQYSIHQQSTHFTHRPRQPTTTINADHRLNHLLRRSCPVATPMFNLHAHPMRDLQKKGWFKCCGLI